MDDERDKQPIERRRRRRATPRRTRRARRATPPSERRREAAAAAGGSRAGGRRHLTELYIPRAWIAGMGVALLILLLRRDRRLRVRQRQSHLRLVPRHRTRGRVVRRAPPTTPPASPVRTATPSRACSTTSSATSPASRTSSRTSTGNYHKPVTTFVGTENCVQCHPKDEIERDIVVGNIRVNHTGLREAGLPVRDLSRDRRSRRRDPDRCAAQDVDHVDLLAVSQRRRRVAALLDLPHQRRAAGHGPGHHAAAHEQRRLRRVPRQALLRHAATTASRCRIPNGWPRTHGATVLDRGKAICVRLPPQGRSALLRRLPRRRDAASRRLAGAARQRRRRRPAGLREVPRQGPVRDLSRSADAAPGRLGADARRDGDVAVRRSVRSATAPRAASRCHGVSLPHVRASSTRTGATCPAAAALRQVPRQPRRRCRRLLRWRVSPAGQRRSTSRIDRRGRRSRPAVTTADDDQHPATTTTQFAPDRPRSVFVGVTGASGAPYALRLVQVAHRLGCEVSLSVSDTGIARPAARARSGRRRAPRSDGRLSRAGGREGDRLRARRSRGADGQRQQLPRRSGRLSLLDVDAWRISPWGRRAR